MFDRITGDVVMAGEQSVTPEFLTRGDYNAREYLIRFWDGDRTIEIDLTSLAKVVYDADKGRERGIDPGNEES